MRRRRSLGSSRGPKHIQCQRKIRRWTMKYSLCFCLLLILFQVLYLSSNETPCKIWKTCTCFFIFLSSIPPSRKSQIINFEKKVAGINFPRFQIYKTFVVINFCLSRISKTFAEETLANKTKIRENTKVSSKESFFL